MLKRKFGKSEVSILGYGAMRLPVLNENYADINRELAIKQIRYAIDKGINYIDTAYVYHEETSEGLVAEALQDGYRERVFIADKLPVWLAESHQDFDKLLDLQLERLQTDYIDYFLIHCLTKAHWQICLEHDIFTFLKKAVADGRVKNVGFSFHDELPLFKEIVDSFDWDFCMIQYNIVDEKYQAGYAGLKYAHAKGLSVAVMEPLRGGMLANNVPADIQAIYDTNDKKRTPAAWGLQFVWNHPEVSLLLSGMNTYEQIDENIALACDSHANLLDQSEIGIINKVRDAYNAKIAVNCTSCKYCMPCPVGVNIPLAFEYYNYGQMFSDLKTAKGKYNIFVAEENRADKCISCGKCLQHCPQNIDIPTELKKIADTFGKLN